MRSAVIAVAADVVDRLTAVFTGEGGRAAAGKRIERSCVDAAAAADGGERQHRRDTECEVEITHGGDDKYDTAARRAGSCSICKVSCETRPFPRSRKPPGADALGDADELLGARLAPAAAAPRKIRPVREQRANAVAVDRVDPFLDAGRAEQLVEVVAAAHARGAPLSPAAMRRCMERWRGKPG
jgi:hypothetical protein